MLRRVHKYVHVALQTCAGVFIILGMVYVGKYKKLSRDTFFYSLHSWTGIIAIAMYFLQYIAGSFRRMALSSFLMASGNEVIKWK